MKILISNSYAAVNSCALGSLSSVFKVSWVALEFPILSEEIVSLGAGMGPELLSRAAILKVWSNSISNVWKLVRMQILWPHLLSQKLWEWGPAI